MADKAYVADIDRSIYDIKDDEKDAYKVNEGLTPDIVQKYPRKSTIRSGCSFSDFRRFKYIMKCRCRIGAPQSRGLIWSIL